MHTISDTSPISNLAVIGRLDLMRAIYGTVLIPEAVRKELDGLGNGGARELIRRAEADGWLKIVSVSGRSLVLALQEELDAGEAEAITLAVELGGRLVLDELDGRVVARRLGVPVRGVLWVLKQGKRLGLLDSLRDEIARLRIEAHFWISARLEEEFLAEAGE